MKTDELMKGNIIRFTFANVSHIIKVRGVVGDTVYFGTQDFAPIDSDFTPIEITEDYLIDLGFRRVKHPVKIGVINEANTRFFFVKGDVVFDFNNFNRLIVSNRSIDFNIKYVHQLQNILTILER